MVVGGHFLHLFYLNCIVKQGLGLLSLCNPFIPIVGHVFYKDFKTLLFIPQAPLIRYLDPIIKVFVAI